MRVFNVKVNGNEYKVEIEEEGVKIPLQRISSSARNLTEEVREPVKNNEKIIENPVIKETNRENEIKAPMPGSVVAINVKIGEKISKGKPILILEAMKMENEITSPIDGIISEIKVKEGSIVNTDDILAVVS